MRIMPISWLAAIGGFFGAREGKRAITKQEPWVDKVHGSLQRYASVTDEKDRERRIVRCTRRIGRVYAEFAALQRIANSDRLEVVGMEHLSALSGPVILAGCHLGNWELMGHILTRLANPSCALYDPPENPVRHRLAVRARKAWMSDLQLVAASPRAMFELVRALKAGRNLLLYVDEEKNGAVWAPSLGRDLPYAGNRWLAARLAARHDVSIVPIYVEERAASRYRIVIEPPLDPEPGEPEIRARELADALDRKFDKVIGERIEQWYWLPWLDPDKPLSASQYTAEATPASR